jgi:hypothetical protein
MDEANVGLHVSLEAVEAHAERSAASARDAGALGAERGELAQTLLEHLIRRDVAVATAPLCQCGPVLVRNDRLVAGEDVREDRQRYEDPELERRNDYGRDLGRFSRDASFALFRRLSAGKHERFWPAGLTLASRVGS